ncbi:hypothetical protein [uncultured Megasphaera sp.]|uniref:hypothetical protein n=1 Tax=uncultured Megasphaera sp. TaxID=165188 RepID=UPI002657FA2F|nr:hypothetical protein [uncultured Megasphaera sp.]
MLPKTSLVRKALERLYDGQATVWVYQDGAPDESGIVSPEPQKTGPYPCRVSYKTTAPAEQGDRLASFDQSITLFLSPDIIIAVGSDIDVEQRGRTLQFTAAGVPAVYDSHQEIPLLHRGKYDG